MDYQGKVAVVTGGGSGIGRSLAHAFAKRGARIVLADIEKPALDSVASELERAGSEVLALRVDVADSRQVTQLAESVYEAFGAAHVLCNNAGIALRRPRQGSLARGVGLGPAREPLRCDPRPARVSAAHARERRAVPHRQHRLARGADVDAGICALQRVEVRGGGDQRGARAWSAPGSNVGVSVLCPGWVKTRIAESERHAGPEIPARPETPESAADAGPAARPDRRRHRSGRDRAARDRGHRAARALHLPEPRTTCSKACAPASTPYSRPGPKRLSAPARRLRSFEKSWSRIERATESSRLVVRGR